MKPCLICAAVIVGISLVACDPGYDTPYPGRDHVAAFTPVAAMYSIYLTTYDQQFGNGSQAPLTMASIIVATDANLCTNLSATINPPNGARLILQGMIDGDATNIVPSTTWSQPSNTFGNNASQLDVCYATFLGFNSSGLVDASLGANSGSVSFAQASNSNTMTINLNYNLDMQVTGTPLSLKAQNLAVSMCAH